MECKLVLDLQGGRTKKDQNQTFLELLGRSENKLNSTENATKTTSGTKTDKSQNNRVELLSLFTLTNFDAAPSHNCVKSKFLT